jgi:hypothetical protein
VLLPGLLGSESIIGNYAGDVPALLRIPEEIRLSFISAQDHARNRLIHALYARCKGTRAGL